MAVAPNSHPPEEDVHVDPGRTWLSIASVIALCGVVAVGAASITNFKNKIDALSVEAARQWGEISNQMDKLEAAITADQWTRTDTRFLISEMRIMNPDMKFPNIPQNPMFNSPREVKP